MTLVALLLGGGALVLGAFVGGLLAAELAARIGVPASYTYPRHRRY